MKDRIERLKLNIKNATVEYNDFMIYITYHSDSRKEITNILKYMREKFKDYTLEDTDFDVKETHKYYYIKGE